MSLDPHELAAIYRREVGRCTATLVRVLGDVDRAEDAVADAFAVAADRWRVDGVPPNPGGWITTTARNLAIDRHRREVTRDAREREAMTMARHDPAPHPAVDLGDIDAVPDDQLRLIFLCCHPALGADAQVALTLRLLGGLTTGEIARAWGLELTVLPASDDRLRIVCRPAHRSAGHRLRAPRDRREPECDEQRVCRACLFLHDRDRRVERVV